MTKEELFEIYKNVDPFETQKGGCRIAPENFDERQAAREDDTLSIVTEHIKDFKLRTEGLTRDELVDFIDAWNMQPPEPSFRSILPQHQQTASYKANRNYFIFVQELRKTLEDNTSVVKDYSKFLQECSRYMTGNKFTGSVKEAAAILERQGAAGNFTTSKKAEINRWFVAEFKTDFSADSIKNHWTLKK